MKFENEQNIIKIIQSGLMNYRKYLLNKCFIYVYYNDNLKSFSSIEVMFKKENFKHLCGISAKKEDLEAYAKAGIYKEIISPRYFLMYVQEKN